MLLVIASSDFISVLSRTYGVEYNFSAKDVENENDKPVKESESENNEEEKLNKIEVNLLSPYCSYNVANQYNTKTYFCFNIHISPTQEFTTPPPEVI